MGPHERYAETFSRVARNQLEDDLEEFGTLLDVTLEREADGLWAAARFIAGEEPEEFRRLIRSGVPETGQEDAADDATLFTTHLVEHLHIRAREPEEPTAALPPAPPGSVEAWPGGPHLRLLDPRSVRYRHLQFLRELHSATWARLRDEIAHDPWIGLTPAFTEDGTGAWLEMSMRRRAHGAETVWTYRERVIDADGPLGPADVLGIAFVRRAAADFARRSLS